MYDLRVGNGKVGRPLQLRQRPVHLALLHDQCRGVRIEDLPDGLNLGQDQSSLRRLQIDGNDHEHEGVAGDHILKQRPLLLALGLEHGDELPLELLNPGSGHVGDLEDGDALGAELRRYRRLPASPVAVGYGDEEVCAVLSQVAALRLGHGSRCDVEGDIGTALGAAGAADPPGAEHALVVDPGGVYEDHRSEGQELHPLVHGIGGGARRLRNNRELAAGNAVYEARLAAVARTEQHDMGPEPPRRVNHQVPPLFRSPAALG